MAHCAAAGGYVRSGCGAEGCGRSVGEAFPPPSETNFSGGWLAGDQAACQAACQAFTEAVLGVAAGPLERI
ncbi:MAG: hypothetical protein ACLSAH_23485 [Bilophila wadsworthia]